jgi:hypothetical protein
MISANRRSAFACIGLAALALAGCANSGGGLGAFGGAPARPKTVVVSDFLLSSDVMVIDRGYTARLERKVGSFPTHERKPRTIARVNDEIVASIVASLREAGLDAQPGSVEGLSLKDQALVVSGRLRPGDLAAVAKNKQIAFVGGRGGVTADMALSYVSGGGKRQLLSFSADAKGAGKPPVGKQAAARNAVIAEALVAAKAAPEKLSPDVEAQSRRLGRAVGEQIVAYAKGQGWLEKPESAESANSNEAQPVERVAMPPPRPGPQPDAGNKPED